MSVAIKQKLIKYVSNFPVLYDTEHEDYNNVTYKDQLWDEIAENTGIEDGITARTYWENLRDSFRKYLIRGDLNAQKWNFYDDMSFMNKYLVEQKDGNLSGSRQTSETLLIEPLNGKYSRMDQSLALFKANKIRIEEQAENDLEPTNNALYNFFYLIYETTAQFPEHIQCEVKTKVYNIVSEYEEELFNASDVENYNSVEIIETSISPQNEENKSVLNFTDTIQFERLYQDSCDALAETDQCTSLETIKTETDDVDFSLTPEESTVSPKTVDSDIFIPLVEEKQAESTSSRRRLKKRVVSGKDEKPFVCDICGATCKESSNFAVHRNRHLGIKPYSCSICDRSFAASTDMKKHKLTHSNERRFKCDECDHTFKAASSLKKHRYRHTNERNHVCQICDKRFYEKQLLREHMAVHSGERSYVCPTCNVGFKLQKGLRQHMQLHSEVKKYKCKLCGKAFAQHAGVFSHMKSCRKK